MSALAVRAHDVFCLYPTPGGQVAALRGLTLDIEAGSRVVVHGPNGSGKTTLLRVLMGEVPPSAGSVAVCGVELAGAADGERARLRGRRIGLVDQVSGRSLRPEISVLDNVALQLRLAGVGRRAARERARGVLDRLGLAQLAKRRPTTLSGGEAQRVAVCAAVAHEPELVFADEPTGELDQGSADEVYDLLVTAAAAHGAALLVVSHDSRAARIADRIIRIRDGRLSEEWQPSGEEALVVDDRGWVRLPEPLRRRTGLVDRARAGTADGAITLAPLAPSVSTVDAPASLERAAPGPEVARLSGLRVVRDDRVILSNVDVGLRAGTLTAVQGRSGSGKTTLLRVLCGLERPTEGTVTIAGTDLAGLDRAALAALRRAHVGVAGQGTALVETMDVVENLDLVRLARHRPADPERVAGLIADLGLTALRHRPVRVMSGGERQRVAVARVLAAEPELAVFDEPTSHQDEAHAELVVAALVAAAARGVAVVAATHDPVLTAAADTTLALNGLALDGAGLALDGLGLAPDSLAPGAVGLVPVTDGEDNRETGGAIHPLSTMD
jgi:ABC-type lipoprotein export system ATPase subunit